MKRSNIKARIKKDELNPLFHFKDKEEDDKVLTKTVIKQALKSGKLVLSSKNLKFGKFEVCSKGKVRRQEQSTRHIVQ